MIKFSKKNIIVIILLLSLGGILLMTSNHWIHRSTSLKAIFYCPMHPTYTSDSPGTCPICNMNLVKREDDPKPRDLASGQLNHTKPDAVMHHGGPMAGMAVPRVFTIQELINMKPGEICLLHKCKMGTCQIAMTEEFARLGKCPHCGEDLGVVIKDLIPQGYAEVKLSGEKQRAIELKTEPVKKTLIAKTIRAVGRIAYDPQLYQAEGEYLQSLAALRKVEMADPELKEQAARLVDAAKMKLRLLGLSDTLIEELEKSGKPDHSLLYSDAGGPVWLYASIYEYEISLVKVGASVEAEAPAIPGGLFRGVVRSIDPVVDPVTRSIRIRAMLENPDAILKPEMYVNVILNVNLGEGIVVPPDAVFATGEKNIIFVAKPDGVFEPREVVLGVKTEMFQEIKSGVAEGEQVVVSGNFLIDSESRLKAALQDIGSGGGHQHG